ncbi:MAG: NAD(+)/NADH kinase [Holophagae bacterium]|nr:NAD(+)/NADH kinase [Holophagae bacterium]
MTDFNKIGVVYKPKADTGPLNHSFQMIARALKKWGLDYVFRYQDLPETNLDAELNKMFKQVSREQFRDTVDMVIVLGGDGTLLSLARMMSRREVPIFGVNLGHLGFLTEIPVDSIEDALEQLIAGRFTYDNRLMLHGEILDQNDDVVVSETVLNDVVVNKAALARIMDLTLTIDGSFASDYRSDGLIVATPTGSTAYSLAAGGAIIFPNTDVLAVTPICPHSLTNRPIVLDAGSVIEISLSHPHENVYATFDGQLGFRFFSNYRLRVKRSERKVRLIKPVGTYYFEVLKEKLKWGER